MSILYPQVFILLLIIFLLKRASLKELNRTNGLLFLSLIFAIIALSRPVISTKIDDKKALLGEDVIIALDISYSMQANDIKPNRLFVAKELIKKLVTDNKDDRFSLFAFTTNPLVLSPPTTDNLVLQSALESINDKFILTHGTDLENLLKKIATLKRDIKNLIIFSDGGDEIDLVTLLNIAKSNNIRIFSVGVATDEGTILRDKYNNSIKDIKDHIVISKLNPLLKELALNSGGDDIAIDEIDTLMDKIAIFNTHKSFKNSKSLQRELFWIPLLISLGLFFFAFVVIPKKLLLIFPFIVTSSDAFILDWYYIQKAEKSSFAKEYDTCISSLNRLTHKSMQSELKLAYCYYKNKNYKIALSIYKTLKTNDAKIKKVILFGKANTLAHLEEFVNARDVYLEALVFGEDEDIYHNLKIVQKRIHEKKQSLPNPFRKKLHKIKKEKSSKKSDKKGKSSNSKMEGEPIEAGSNSASSKQEKKTSHSSSTLSHPLSYKAYELINKGYIHEKNPW